ncbi:MAG TPA: hypothetical protein VNT75_17395 [Symbiobacteriaceae bacterium]|nr:hypothetical protein [Symbiobacteriaceae bacterium]
MLTIVYLVLGLAFMGGLFYALMQITARQRRLTAELTRLERLAAEVSMNAEAILDRVDERTHRLHELMERAEARVAAAVAAPVPVAAPAPVATPAPVVTPAAVAAPPEPEELPEPTSMQKYQGMRTAVWHLADKGKNPSDIAQELGIPRGEVLLLLNLRTKKVTA